MELISTAVENASYEAANTIDVTSLDITPADAYARGAVDINFFMALALPDVAKSALPLFYIVCWQMLVNRDSQDVGKILRFALGLPRGHAKTTFIKVLICWLLAYDKFSFVLIVCANEGLAENLLADIDDILSTDTMQGIYGNWSANLSTDTTSLKKAIYRGRSVVLVAKGAGSSLRGINIKNRRPDLIFCDDMQTRENDESPAERLKLLRWMIATLFKVLPPNGDRLIIYVGNMYSEVCILKMLADNPQWISLVTGAILENGLPLWPELFTIEDLMESYKHDESLGLAELWFAEVMNDPKAAATTLLHDVLPVCPYRESDDPDGCYITIDPAGYRKMSDDNVVVGHIVINDVPAVKHIIADKMNPEELIKHALSMAIEMGASVIGVEAVAYQQTLMYWLDYFMKLLNITGISIVELSPHGLKKEIRIREFIQELYAETYYLMEGETKHLFTFQANAYKLGKKDNKDDILDGVAYGLDMRRDYWHLIKNNRRDLRLAGQARVQSNNTPF